MPGPFDEAPRLNASFQDEPPQAASGAGRIGQVSLVGAGPGSADLITVRGLKCLRSADAVLHDALISAELLREARSDSQILSVGKRGYCVGSTRQETIHELLVRLAQSGLSVCRLQCGDPCIFGRGGEEALFLAEARIPFQIIPGVTSALGAAAEAAIPLTHREVASSLTLLSGHHDPDGEPSAYDWTVLAKLPTLAFYMAGRNLAKIARRLTVAGMPLDMPVAVIESGTLAEQVIHISDLEALQKTLPAFSGKPTLLLVGRVVAYREKMQKLFNPGLNRSVLEGVLA